MTVTMRLLLLAWVFCASQVPILAQSTTESRPRAEPERWKTGLLPHGAIVKYDDRNYVKFEDIGREEEQNSVTPGRAIRLYVMRDGKVGQFGPIGTEYPLGARLSSSVTHIQYAGPDRLWIVSELGKNFDGAILINLDRLEIEKQYTGLDFSLSPNANHMAFRYPWGGKGHLIFVDETMVYPKVESGFVEIGPDQPKRKDGTTAREITVWGDIAAVRRESPLVWVSHDELQALLKEELRGGGQRYVSARISNISGGPGRAAVPLVERRVLPQGDAEALRASLIRKKQQQRQRHMQSVKLGAPQMAGQGGSGEH